MIAWLKLRWLESKLTFGEFGKLNKYRRLCLERNATSAQAKVRIAEEVLAGPGVNSLEARSHAAYLKERDISP